MSYYEKLKLGSFCHIDEALAAHSCSRFNGPSSAGEPLNQIINGIGSTQRCLKYRFFARTNHIDIIEVWMLVLRHTEPVADHFLNHHPVEALGF